MKVSAIGDVATMVTLPEGGLFAYRRRETTYVAIKLTDGKMVAVLWPRHPHADELKAGLVSLELLATEPLWAIPEAVVRLSSDPTALRSQTEYPQAAGSLVFGDSAAFATIHQDPHHTAWVKLNNCLGEAKQRRSRGWAPKSLRVV
jgi:hypothetical protein